MRQFWLLGWLLMVSSHLHSQPYPTEYFQSPLRIPLVMSGTFGELRHNHFHAGVDFKTQGREGLSIVATAEGYVSRVKVSPTGYGLAIYIDHPNGYTTVYGHLRSFYPELEQYVERLQHTLTSYAIDVYPERGRFTVAAGQIIGESGNTGGSAGPHLHFEIRETVTEIPIHPLLFGFDVEDTKPPVMQTLYIYEKPAGSFRPVRKQVQLKSSGGSYVIQGGSLQGQNYQLVHPSDTLLIAAANMSFGLYTFDRANQANNRNGIYLLNLKVDGERCFGFTMDGIPFNESKYINSHIDYCYQRESRRFIHTCYREPGNFLSVYDTLVSDGWLQLQSGIAQQVQLTVGDPMGNTSQLVFWIKYTGTPPNAYLGRGKVWTPQHTNHYSDSLFSATLPAWSLYDTLQVSIDQLSESPVKYTVGDDCIPLHYGIDIALRADLPERLQPKAVVMVEREGQTYPQKGYWKEDWLHANSPYFGTYFVDVDTTAPTVTPLRTITPGQRLAFRINDGRTGINTYRATWNGKWILLTYDAKRSLLSGQLPPLSEVDEQIFRLAVSDYCDNTTVITQVF